MFKTHFSDHGNTGIHKIIRKKNRNEPFTVLFIIVKSNNLLFISKL